MNTEKVAAIDSERIILEDGRSMRRDFLHLDQGVCITSYASQCRTVRETVAIAPLSSFAELDAKTFYVLASRATHRAIFYTDCKEAFKEAVLREGNRQSVWEYMKGSIRQAVSVSMPEIGEKARLEWQRVVDLQPGKKVEQPNKTRGIER